MCRPKRVWILRRVGLKTDIDFAHLGLETGIVFETVMYERFCRSIPNESERKKYANSRSYLRNDVIIS